MSKEEMRWGRRVKDLNAGFKAINVSRETRGESTEGRGCYGEEDEFPEVSLEELEEVTSELRRLLSEAEEIE